MFFSFKSSRNHYYGKWANFFHLKCPKHQFYFLINLRCLAMYMKNTLKNELSLRYASLTLTESVRIYQKCTPKSNSQWTADIIAPPSWLSPCVVLVHQQKGIHSTFPWEGMYRLSSDHHKCHLSDSLLAKTLWWMLQMAESR